MNKVKALIILAFLFFVSACSTSSKNAQEDAKLSEQIDAVQDQFEGPKNQGTQSGGQAKNQFQDSSQDDFSEFGEKGQLATEDEVSAAQNDNLNKPAQEAPPPAIEQPPAEPLPPVASQTAPSTVNNDVVNINFLSNANGGTVVIKTSQPATYTTRENPAQNQFVIELENTNLPKRLMRPFNMRDFSGAFGSVDAYQNSGSSTARIVIQLRESGVVPQVQQEGNSLLVIASRSSSGVADNPPPAAEPAPVADNPPPPVEEQPVVTDDAGGSQGPLQGKTLDEFMLTDGKFYGKKISIELKNADVREVIGLLAEESGINILVAEGVKGTMSLRLREIPWDQALVVVMKAKQLGYLRQGSVLRIDLLENIQKEAKMAQDIINTRRVVEPLYVKMVSVSYSKVEDLENQVKQFSTPRGKIVADKRTSSLIITDVKDITEKIENVVKSLDIPPPQVLIEGKIVEASDDFKRNVGVNWGYTGANSATGGQTEKGSATNMRSDLRVIPLGANSTGTFDLNFHVVPLDFFGDLHAFLSLSESKNEVKIISSPRVVTMHNETAEISQTTEVPIISTTRGTTGDLTKAVSFKPIKLNLKVLPQISSSNRVTMNVEVVREFVGAVVDQETQAQPVHSRTAKTTILVKDGQTAVIGGIYQSDSSRNETGVPWLSKVPVIGWLFKGVSNQNIKNELLIFLTPHVLSQADESASTSEVN